MEINPEIISIFFFCKISEHIWKKTCSICVENITRVKEKKTLKKKTNSPKCSVIIAI